MHVLIPFVAILSKAMPFGDTGGVQDGWAEYSEAGGGYTNDDTLPEWRIQASCLGCREAAGVLITLTANLRARYRAKRHIYTNPNANLNANLNANPNANP
jgi:hypothetical protein